MYKRLLGIWSKEKKMCKAHRKNSDCVPLQDIQVVHEPDETLARPPSSNSEIYQENIDVAFVRTLLLSGGILEQVWRSAHEKLALKNSFSPTCLSCVHVLQMCLGVHHEIVP